MPDVSLIIPTHNRRHVLQRNLAALEKQTYPLEKVEVIVVADGCEDDTAVLSATYQPAYTFHLLSQPALGPAKARNIGAQTASSPLLIFMDDDIEAAPHFIEAHVTAHQQQPGQVILGYLPPHLPHQTGFFRLTLQYWWENMFDQMREPDHRYTYTNLLSGNFSLSSELFRQVDGFDVTFSCHEDYELGYRLLKAGARFQFIEAAMGTHHENTDLARALQRKRQEGIADVILGNMYPELRPSLLVTGLYYFARRPGRVLFSLIHLWPRLGDLLAHTVQSSLPPWETLRLRNMWQRLLDGLLAYWYWRGVAQVLPKLRDVTQFVTDKRIKAVPVHEIALDLALGLEQAETLLDTHNPETAVIHYGNRLIGRIPVQPGAERLNGRHLRRLLTTTLLAPTLKTFALAGEINLPVDIENLTNACDQIIQRQAKFEILHG